MSLRGAFLPFATKQSPTWGRDCFVGLKPSSQRHSYPMPNTPLFAGLVIDEAGRPAESAFIGSDPCYVVNDDGFKRHIPAEQVDRAVLAQMAEMLGQEDPFSKAIIEQQLKNIDKQFDALMQTGIPEDMRAYLGMMGFKVVINYHGEIVRVEQPGSAGGGEGDGE